MNTSRQILILFCCGSQILKALEVSQMPTQIPILLLESSLRRCSEGMQQQAVDPKMNKLEMSGLNPWYTHFHKYGLQPMRKTTHLFSPEWYQYTFLLSLFVIKREGSIFFYIMQCIATPLWRKQVRCFAHWLQTIFMEVGVQGSWLLILPGHYLPTNSISQQVTTTSSLLFGTVCQQILFAVRLKDTTTPFSIVSYNLVVYWLARP